MAALRVVLILVIVYFILICPRVVHRPDRSAFQTKLFAHRGLFDNHSEAPENSLPAFARAVEAGFGIELDVQMSKDRVPVVFHDLTLKRVCGVDGRVKDYTYEELSRMPLCGSGQHMPKFSEVLSLVRGRVPMIVEYKTEDTDMSLCPPIDAMLTAYQKEYAAEYCIESFNPLVLGWYRRHHSSVMRGQLSDGFLYDPKMRGVFYKTIFLFTLQFLLWNCYTAPDFIAYNVKYRRNPSRCLCHGLFRNLAAAWTVRSEKELEEAKGHFDVMIFDSFVPERKDGAPV